MRDISGGEPPSDRAKSTLPKGLRRRRAMAWLRLLPDGPHRLRRRASPWLRRRSQRGLRDFLPGLPGCLRGGRSRWVAHPARDAAGPPVGAAIVRERSASGRA